ncbi:unnamed protein product, partial [Closterium sp. NIES-53]
TTLAALGFAPSTADPSLFLRTDTSLPPFYILVYVDDLVFATADTSGLAYVKSELQKRHTCTDLGELRSYLGLQITRDRARRTITLTQSHMVQQVLQRFGFTYSSPQATPLPTRHSLSALPSDDSVEPSGPILARYVAPRRHRPEHMAAAKRVLRYLCSTSGMGLVLGGQSPVVLTGHADASWADDQTTQRSSQGYTFSLGSGSVSWRATRSSSVLGSSCEAEIYAGAMAAQELRWLTYLLTDLGEPPRSPPVLYVDNKAMVALCREQRLEHRTKHIALRYFLARELQQRGQLRLAYVASEANTADVFTKALAPCDHQRFCSQLGLICPVRELDVVTKLSTLSVVEVGEVAVLSVEPPASLTSTVTRANDIRATTPRRPTQKPLTKLRGRLGLAPTLLLLTLATSRFNTPSASPTATSPTAATRATPTIASTTASRAPTPSISPTAATTSTAAPTTTPATTSTTTAATSTTLATLSLAAAALRTSKSSPDVLSNRDVCSSSRGVGGGKGGGGAPLKEGRARSATSSTYSNRTSLSGEEMLLEEVNSEGGGVKREKVVPDRAKRVREASDYEVE